MSGAILVFGCLVWFPLIIWILALIHWMIAGEIDAASGILGVVFGFGMGYTALKPPLPILSPIAFCLVVGTVIFFPFLRAVLEHRERKNIDVEGVERAYEALGQRPDNVFAKFKLAQSVYRLGMIGHGVALADYAMSNVPENLAIEEHRLLKRWKAAGVPPETLRPIECIECRRPCQPGWTHCRNCGSPFLLDRAKGRIMPVAHARQLMAIWAALVLAALGVPAASTLPGLASPLVILLVLAGGGAFVALSFRHAGSNPA